MHKKADNLDKWAAGVKLSFSVRFCQCYIGGDLTSDKNESVRCKGKNIKKSIQRWQNQSVPNGDKKCNLVCVLYRENGGDKLQVTDICVNYDNIRVLKMDFKDDVNKQQCIIR